MARVLVEHGINRGSAVALYLERCNDFLAAMLGVLKAGAAFIPIEPEYPAQRVRFMLGDCKADGIITRAGLLALARDAAAPGCRCIVALDGEAVASDATELQRAVGRASAGQIASRLEVLGAQQLATASPDDLPLCGTSDDLAYMMYTSGSTGQPKAAMIEHGGKINHIYGQFHALALRDDLVMLQSAPSSSDISVWQFLAPVLVGGHTVIVSLDVVRDPRRLLRVLRDEKITLFEPVPAVLQALVDHVATLEPSAAICHLQWLMATGEAISPALVNRWLSRFPNIPLVNAYGPTEAADDTSQAIFRHPISDRERSVSIGTSLANLSMVVVDDRLRLVPRGAPGEICVSGIGVGRGYLGHPERTAAAFVANPIPDTFGATLYRTGDLGRWRPNGSLEFLGRIDHQVKLRGYR
ncbi:MAG: amino acid adenylation domain-containing protein, partial [Myxococcota bacterium]